MTGSPEATEPQAAPSPNATRTAASPAEARRQLKQHKLHGQGPAVLAVSAGGGLGAATRYGAGLLWPATTPGAFPWTTLGINALGCALIGVLMVLLTEPRPATRPPRPLLRPFLCTGVLGGFTTFSTYAVDIERLVGGGHAATALGYLGATVAAALLSVWAGTALTRRCTKGPS